MLAPGITIIGGGPAGATAGWLLSRKQFKVHLLEKEEFPRDKICGCCLNESALQIIRDGKTDKYPVDIPPFFPQKELVLHYKKRNIKIPLPGGIILSRIDLDRFLLERAIEAGCKVKYNTKVNIPENIEKLSLPDDLSLETSIICIASGLDPRHSTPNSKKLGLGAKWLRPDSSYPKEAGRVNMWLSNEGYLGETLLPDGSIAYAAAINRKYLKSIAESNTNQSGSTGYLLSRLFCLPHLEELKWKGTPLLKTAAPSTGKGTCIRIGDAAGYIEPFTGQGMAWAINSGKMASDLIETHFKDHKMNDLGHQWNSVLNKKMSYSRKVCSVVSGIASKPDFCFSLLSLPFSSYISKNLINFIYRN
ncbi:MAG TPA: NAD(P)-binding protein [Oligoflexia bacterium]|nr:NAD(P)-binding protein [Oligoflexia bacterium]HMP49557.1 NAD(P)-binding protein [Oligoflexia bacterium]